MQIIVNIFAFILSICFLILTHELGHFFVARIFKVKILKFSIGFGKAIWRRNGKDGVEYAIGFLPLGGYVKMLDTREMKVKESELGFSLDKKPFWQKILIVFAGPLTNIFIGILAFWLMFIIGVKAPKPIIGKVIPDSIAANAGLLANDEIIAVDDIKTFNWQDVMLPLFSHLGDNDKVNFQVYNPQSNKKNNYQLDLTNWRLDTTTFDMLHDLGIEPYAPKVPPIIAKIEKHTPAANADLRIGDQIISVDNIAVDNWNDFVRYLHANPKKLMHIQIMRTGKIAVIDVLTDWKYGPKWKKIGFLGVSPQKVDWPASMLSLQRYSIFGALEESLRQTKDFIAFNAVVIKKLIMRKIPISVLGGPISIFQSSSSALNQGAVIYVGFIAIFSVMLAFVNLIPIPGLDGGHILIFALEGIIRRPISLAVQILLFKLGFIFLILLAVQATLNDFMRIFA